jgi:hypothetical protein
LIVFEILENYQCRKLAKNINRNPRKYENAPMRATTLVTYAVNNWLVLTGGGGGLTRDELVRSGLRADPSEACDFYCTHEKAGSTGKEGDTNGAAGRPKQSRLCIIFLVTDTSSEGVGGGGGGEGLVQTPLIRTLVLVF